MAALCLRIASRFERRFRESPERSVSTNAQNLFEIVTTHHKQIPPQALPWFGMTAPFES
jgi:hypothetical protein